MNNSYFIFLLLSHAPHKEYQQKKDRNREKEKSKRKKEEGERKRRRNYFALSSHRFPSTCLFIQSI